MSRFAGGLRTLLAFYLRIGRTYWAWGPMLILLALIVFVPLGLLDAIVAEAELQDFDFGSGFKVVLLLAAIGVLTATSLLGEVFYAGAVAVYLTHPEDKEAPRLRSVARHINYQRLIALDLLYVLMVVLGLIAFFVPGLLVFIFFGLAGPIVEIEDRGIRAAFRRSYSLVRGSFWLVFFVLGPLELVGDAFAEGVEHLVHHWLGESFVAIWLGEAAANTITSPLFAIAAVLLTLDLITKKDGSGPVLNRRPAPAATVTTVGAG
jgi:hypothetical protein